jgi:PAS domain S-box-containing protein
MQAKLKTEIKFVAGFAVSLVALLVLMVLSYQTTKNLIATENWVAHTHEVITTLDAVQTGLFAMEAANRGYILSGSPRYLNDEHVAAQQIPAQLQRLRTLTDDNPVQQEALGLLDPLITRRIKLLDERVTVFQQYGLEAAADGAALLRGKIVMDQIQGFLDQMRATEDELRDRRQQLSNDNFRQSLVIISVGAFALCFLGVLATVMFWHDFKVRAHAADILRQSEERIRLMIESVKDYALIMLDPGGHIVQWNEGARRLKGYEAHEIIGQHFSRFYPEEVVRAGFPDQELAIARTEGRVQNEGWRLRKDGSRFWADVTISAMRNAKGELLGFVKVTRDLTERERIRRELQDSRAQLQSILDNSPALVFVKDLAGRYQFVNRTYEMVFGQSREHIIGKTPFDLVDRDAALIADGHHRRILETNAPIEVEETIAYPDGPHPHLAVKFPLRDANGKIYATSGISTDISVTKRMEQIQKERDRFFDLTRDVICVAGFDGYFRTLNPAWENTLGFSMPELLATPFIDFVHPDDRTATQAEVAKLGEGGETVNFENRYRCKDGSYRWLSWNARAALPQKLIYAAARDITEQKESRENIVRLNEDLRSHAAQLETANKELEAFSYSVSHDLRAPVRHIDGFVKMLAKHSGGSFDEQGRRYLEIIADAAHQMGSLIDDLLLFSRMSRADLHPAGVAHNSLVDEAISSLQTETSGRNIRWQIASLPLAQGDPAMLRQVWINLIANAVKYSRPRDPAEIEIGGRDAGDGETIFFVRDNGVGFDMQYVDKLFGVFQRLHRAEEFEGTGIGLANVRRIVSRHGGRTWAESKPNEGSTFYFSLPNILNIKSNHK